LPEELGWREYNGRGLSYSAWADGPFSRNVPVAVVGCGCFAIHQAAMLSRVASSVTIICESPSIDRAATPFTTFLDPCVVVETATRVKGILPKVTDRTLLGGLLLERGAELQELLVDGVFVATNPIVDWDVWGGLDAANDLVGRGKLSWLAFPQE